MSPEQVIGVFRNHWQFLVDLENDTSNYNCFYLQWNGLTDKGKAILDFLGENPSGKVFIYGCYSEYVDDNGVKEQAAYVLTNRGIIYREVNAGKDTLRGFYPWIAFHGLTISTDAQSLTSIDAEGVKKVWFDFDFSGMYGDPTINQWAKIFSEITRLNNPGAVISKYNDLIKKVFTNHWQFLVDLENEADNYNCFYLQRNGLTDKGKAILDFLNQDTTGDVIIYGAYFESVNEETGVKGQGAYVLTDRGLRYRYVENNEEISNGGLRWTFYQDLNIDDENLVITGINSQGELWDIAEYQLSGMKGDLKLDKWAEIISEITRLNNSSASITHLPYTELTEAGNSDNSGNIDRSKVEYIVGIDFGHGETSAALCAIQWDVAPERLESPRDLEFEQNKKVLKSAIAIAPDGSAYIGVKAFDPVTLQKAQLHVCFKKKPESINGEAEQLMIRFMHEVYLKIREVAGVLTDDNHVVYIATPSGWDKAAQDLYLQMAQQAGLPMAGVTKESRAAFVRAQRNPDANLGRNIDNGAIVFDMGSSTLDFTYYNASLDKMIDNGYDCGASFIEKAIYGELLQSQECVKRFSSKHPTLVDYLLFEARQAKETIYESPSRPFNRSYNFEDFVEDEELEDDKFRIKYGPGELNQFLQSNGYIDSIRNAMLDFARNYISGKKIYGVYLTGSASRMDFIKPLVSECWNVPMDKIVSDTDPSLTISKGVAEVARMDLRTENLGEDLEPLFAKITGNAVYDRFTSIFGNYLYEQIAGTVADKCLSWRDSVYDASLNQLQYSIQCAVERTVRECSARVDEAVQIAIDENTAELRQKVDEIVKSYTAQGAKINAPSITNVNVANGIGSFDMSGIINQLSSSIANESSNWGGMIAGASLGAAAALIFGGPLAWIIGGGALLGKWLFGEEETEAQKRQKAMRKRLDSGERIQICNGIYDKWQEITNSISNSIGNSLNNNAQARHSVATSVDRMLAAYKDALKQARIMVD